MVNLNKFKTYVLGSGTSESAIIKNMAKLASGDGISRVIGIATMPVITRIYLPEHLGVLSVFVAIVAVIAPIATFRYSLAIPLPKSDGMAMNIVFVSFGVLFATSIFVSIVFSLWGTSILTLLSMEQLIPYWYLIPVAIIGTGIYEVLSNWAVREKAFSPLAKTKVWQKSIGAVTKIGLGLVGLKPLGLLVGHIFTKAGGIVTLFREFAEELFNNIGYLTKHRVIFSAKRYADFPKYRMPSQVMLILSSKLVLFFFAWQYGADTAGLMGLALMMVMMPVTLFGYTTGKAYYGEIAKIGKNNSAEIFDLTKSIVKKLFLVSIFPFVILFAFGPWLFEIVFGIEWTQAGKFASILSIYLLVQFIYAPISEGVFNVFEKQSTIFGIEIGRLILTVLSLFIVFWLDLSSITATWIYSLSISIHYFLATVLVFRIIKNN